MEGGSTHGDVGDDKDDEKVGRTDQMCKLSFRDTLLGGSRDIQVEERENPSDEEVSSDETIEEDAAGPWISTRMTKNQKKIRKS